MNYHTSNPPYDTSKQFIDIFNRDDIANAEIRLKNTDFEDIIDSQILHGSTFAKDYNLIIRASNKAGNFADFRLKITVCGFE